MASLVFVLAALFLLYVLAGYPLLLALLVRVRGARADFQKVFARDSVSILLPVRNGERWLKRQARIDPEARLPQGAARNPGDLRRLDRPDRVDRRGLCRARRAAHRRSRAAARRRRSTPACGGRGGEILFFTDVRQQLDRAALRELVACFGDPSVGVASGELFIRDGTTREEANVGLYWQYEKWIRRRLSRLDSVLGATGCIYAMRRELAVELPEDYAPRRRLSAAGGVLPGLSRHPRRGRQGVRRADVARDRIPPQGTHAGRRLPGYPAIPEVAGASQSHVDSLRLAQARPAAAAFRAAGVGGNKFLAAGFVGEARDRCAGNAATRWRRSTPGFPTAGC